MKIRRSEMTLEEREEARLYDRVWYEKNREARREYLRQNYLDKREHRLARMRAYRAENREMYQEQRRIWCEKNREALRAYHREYARARRAKQKALQACGS